jgi:hypothetical protein
MARPPQYERRTDDDPAPTYLDARAIAKRLPAADRAKLLAWLCLYYGERGQQFEPGARRRRVTIDGEELWLVRIPKRRRIDSV